MSIWIRPICKSLHTYIHSSFDSTQSATNDVADLVNK